MPIDTHRTLLDVMVEQVARGREHVGHRFFVNDSDNFQWVPHTRLLSSAFGFSRLLQAKKVEKGEVCLICCSSPIPMLTSFYGSISRGAIPLILSPPAAMGGVTESAKLIKHLVAEYGPNTAAIIQERIYNNLQSELPQQLKQIIIPDAPLDVYEGHDTPSVQSYLDSNDIAYLQLTSASTGVSKAVAVTHVNVLENVRAIRRACRGREGESGCSWLPLYHDMGLVGGELFSLCNSYTYTLMTPFDFVKRPLRWVKAISKFACTLTAAPNFGYEYCARMVKEEEVAELDLSSLQLSFVGAEPIKYGTLKMFTDRFSPAGFRPQSFLPCYGMAETTCATTLSGAGQSPVYLAIEKNSVGAGQKVTVRNRLHLDSKEAPSIAMDTDTVFICNVGSAIDGLDISIINDQGTTISSELHCGEIAVRGASIVKGYTNNGLHSITGFQNDTVYTGDLGFVYNGELYVVERLKNIIIRNGESFATNALESQLAEMLQISSDQVAIFEMDILDSGTEIVGLIEMRLASSDLSLFEASVRKTLRTIEIPIDRLIITRKREIPRTTSGKKRHFLCRRLLKEGKIPMLHEIDMSARFTKNRGKLE
jgi:acyl-CoA synthetase (AMP-forming)/AMP-acid ligase II